jgi:hypothetical protein
MKKQLCIERRIYKKNFDKDGQCTSTSSSPSSQLLITYNFRKNHTTDHILNQERERRGREKEKGEREKGERERRGEREKERERDHSLFTNVIKLRNGNETKRSIEILKGTLHYITRIYT